MMLGILFLEAGRYVGTIIRYCFSGNIWIG